MSRPPLLSIQDLSIRFSADGQASVALDHLNLDLESGEITALVGESGSGKSVTAMSLLQLIPCPPGEYTGGQLLFRDEHEKQTDLLKLQGNKLEALRGHRIGMIFQEPMSSLNPLMRCGQQVAEVLEQHLNMDAKSAEQEVLRLFEEVKLPDPGAMLRRYPHELSGGQKQRVMIAMAIACKPRLLIADEPTTALDVTVQKVILDLLKDLQQRYGMGILFITHDLQLVRHFADKVAVLFRSRLVEFNTTAAIFSAPKHAYTKGLLACRPASSERFARLQTVQEILDRGGEIKAPARVSGEMFAKRLHQLEQNKTMFELNNLSIHYPLARDFAGRITRSFPAVRSLSLSIKQGETLGLVGESGCGKTTVGKTLVGLQEATDGAILYKGRDMRSFSKEDWAEYRRKVQIIFQDPYASLNPRIPVGQAITEPMAVHGLYRPNERREKMEQLLHKVGLKADQAGRYPHEFSGGQRQRLCIARALALSPEFIICDESVSALDVSVQAQVLNLLMDLREEFGLTYLFISHDLGVVRHISDHIAVMRKGALEEFADADTLFTHPHSAYTRQLLQDSPGLTQE
jgi:peptide/nickel transport system ATP-binding protein